MPKDLEKPRRRGAKAMREQILSEITAIAFASFYDFADIISEEDANGPPRRVVRPLPADKVAPEKRAAVACIRDTSSGPEIKLYDKWRALELLFELYDAAGEGKSAKKQEGSREVRIIDDIQGS